MSYLETVKDIHQQRCAYSMYIKNNDCEPTMLFNEFVDSEICKYYIRIILREKKLNRIING